MRLSLSLLLLLVACEATPPPPPPPKAPRAVRVDRGVIRAFRGYVYSGYALVLGSERPDEADPALLKERQALARAELERSLLAAGAEKGRLEDSARLVSLVRDGIARGGRYALIPRLQGPYPDSIQVVRVKERKVPREVRLFGGPFRYRVTSFDETLVEDYARWRSQELGQPTPREVATYREDGLIQLDLGAAREVGAKLFLPRVEALRAAAEAATEEAFVRRADRLAQLLGLAKAILRWRSLEGLWARISSRSRDEQLKRFALDYAERAELRAAVELHALRRVREEGKELDADARQRLFELGCLSAAIHGDPLGHLADVLGLAVLSLDGPRHAAHFRAARQVVLDLVAKIRGGEPGDRVDAKALFALARSSPADLRELAKELHAQRVK